MMQTCKSVLLLFQAIELASEVLANVKFIQEKKLIGELINHIKLSITFGLPS